MSTEQLNSANLSVEEVVCVKINAPQFYKDEKFLEWLNARDELSIATWHMPNMPISEFSDVFILKDGDACQETCFPLNLWRILLEKTSAHDYCVIWLTNL